MSNATITKRQAIESAITTIRYTAGFWVAVEDTPQGKPGIYHYPPNGERQLIGTGSRPEIDAWILGAAHIAKQMKGV